MNVERDGFHGKERLSTAGKSLCVRENQECSAPGSASVFSMPGVGARSASPLLAAAASEDLHAGGKLLVHALKYGIGRGNISERKVRAIQIDELCGAVCRPHIC